MDKNVVARNIYCYEVYVMKYISYEVIYVYGVVIGMFTTFTLTFHAKRHLTNITHEVE